MSDSFAILWIVAHQASLFTESESRSVVSDSLRPHGLYSPWNSPGQNTGVGSHSLIQGILPTQESNPSPALQADSLPAEPPGKPKNAGVDGMSMDLHLSLAPLVAQWSPANASDSFDPWAGKTSWKRK